MKKLRFGIFSLIFSFALLVFVAPVSADPDLQWKKEVSPKQCDTTGKPVINVEQKVVNDVDSGVAGNYWAFDNYKRHIQVWPQNGGSYCALVSYNGKFTTEIGQTSPGAGGTLSEEIVGSIKGGYRGTITGTLKATPDWSTKGFVGNFDYACDISGNCPGRVSWISQYFDSGFGFTYNWWGWIYHTDRHGTWINSVDGNSGDIL